MDVVRGEFQARSDWWAVGSFPFRWAVPRNVAVAAASKTAKGIAALSKLMVSPKAAIAPAGEGEFIASRLYRQLGGKQWSPAGLWFVALRGMAGMRRVAAMRASRARPGYVGVTPARPPDWEVRRLGPKQLRRNETIL